MSARKSFPKFSHDLLRDHGAGPEVERIWQRVEASIATTVPRAEARPTWPRLAAFAAVAASFVVGVAVGSEWRGDHPQALGLTSESSPAAAPLPPPLVETPQTPPARELSPAQQPKKDNLPPIVHGAPRLRVAPVASVAQVVAPQDLPAQPKPESPSWYVLANRGEFDAARQALDAAGGFDGVVKTASVDELMSLGDVARATENRGRAVQAFREVAQRFPESEQAPVAAMMSGNLLLQSGDHAGAAREFARVRRLNPGGPHVEDALGREFDVAVELGDADRAKKLAEEYAQNFPDGARLGEMQRQLEKLVDEKASSARGDGSRVEPTPDESAE